MKKAVSNFKLYKEKDERLSDFEKVGKIIRLFILFSADDFSTDRTDIVIFIPITQN